MKKKFLITLSLISILSAILTVYAWTNPNQNPPLGGGVLQTDTSGLKIVTTTRITSGNLIVNTGNVGIGTTAPGAKLDVAGVGRLRADGGLGDVLKIGGASIPMGLATEVGGTTPLLNLDINFRQSDKNTSYVGGAFRIDARSPSYPLFQFLSRQAGTTTESVLMSITETGNVGIGTMAPIGKLHVSGGKTLVETLVNQNFGRNILGGKTGVFTGTWASTGQPTKGRGEVAQINSPNLGTIEWTFSSVDQWSFNNSQSAIFVIQGWWRPSDIGSFSANLELWDNCASIWRNVLTFTSWGVYKITDPTGYNNPPCETKVRINITSNSTYFRTSLVELWTDFNPYDWVNTLVAGENAYFGNVGIGTTAPGAKLHINVGSDTGNPINLLMEDSSIPTTWYFAPARFAGAYAPGSLAGDLVLRSANSKNLRITTDNGASTALSILSNGNVGIGTTNPGANLAIAGNRAVLGSSGVVGVYGAGDVSFEIQGGANAAILGLTRGNGVGPFLGLSVVGNDGFIAMNRVGGAPFGNLIIYTGGSERVRINPNGNVGIGTTNPISKLHIYDTSNISGGLGIRLDSGPVQDGLGIEWRTGTTWHWNIDQFGTDPWLRFFIEDANDGSGALRMYLTTAGNLWIAGSLTQGSDVRFKKDISELSNSGSVLEKLKKLRGVYYKLNDLAKKFGYNDDQRHIGIIAQEIEKEFPELVSEWEQDGIKYKAVDYSRLTAVLLEAIKEQQKEIEELKEILNSKH